MKTNPIRTYWVGPLSLALLLALTPGCQKIKSWFSGESEHKLSTSLQNQTNVTNPVAVRTTGEGLKVEDLKLGEGKEATPGRRITVHYTGWLTDGTKFDSSLDRNRPFRFSLGARQVIRGWDLGVVGMKVGGKRKLTIPPELGYGDRGAGTIPPNSTLVFEVELLDVM